MGKQLIKPIFKLGAKLGNSIFCKVSLNRNKNKTYDNEPNKLNQ